MTDLTKTIAPKSDQMNADDLIGGPRTIKVTGVKLLGEADQPIAINYEGDSGKPFKPCKSMRRALVQIWGGDGNQYVGRQMTLYRDEKVQFGGMAVGGIRISHMSDISSTVTLALTASKAKRAPFTVKPLVVERQAPSIDLQKWADDITERLPSYATVEAMKQDWDPHKVALKEAFPDKFRALNSAIQARAAEIMAE